MFCPFCVARRPLFLPLSPPALSSSAGAAPPPSSIAGQCPNSSFLFRAYGQTWQATEGVPLLLPMLHWPDVSQRLREQYAGIGRGTCVGIRAGGDFKGRFISPARYRSALERLRELGEDVSTVFVVSDVPRAWQNMRLENLSTPVLVDGEDIEQLAIARHCRNFVLSRSTYHLWMVYAAIEPAHVLYFNHTLPGVEEDVSRDPHRLGLTNPSWMKPWLALP